MLELRPNCECCNKDLPPAATDAMICTLDAHFAVIAWTRNSADAVLIAAATSRHDRSGRLQSSPNSQLRHSGRSIHKGADEQPDHIGCRAGVRW
jgi:hypothetical protein